MQRVPMLQVLPQAKLFPQVSGINPHASALLHRSPCATQVLDCGLQICPVAQRPQ
jgi:hypothetical protein